jgi:hypothetical protein
MADSTDLSQGTAFSSSEVLDQPGGVAMLGRTFIVFSITAVVFLFLVNTRTGAAGFVQDTLLGDLQEIPTVSFCEMVTHPETYHGKMVRTRAIYVLTWEWKMLYDRQCDRPKNYVWPQFECETDQSCKDMAGLLDKSLVGNPFSGRRAQLTIVGQLRGSQKSGRRYGVLGGQRLAFDIHAIEQTKQISVPRNQRRPKKMQVKH